MLRAVHTGDPVFAVEDGQARPPGPGEVRVEARLLAPLPAGLLLRHAALVEPTAVAVHDVRCAGLARGEKTVVVGGGPIGLLVARVATVEGADVLLLELDEDRRTVDGRDGRDA
jgi:(R,R)-butanediol dehydrogenase/meso-butanediol dehydrogenase/diacetyl reductase